MNRDLVEDAEEVARLIADAGGTIVGRTRLQKIACILELAGLGKGFSFEYRHYGPFSNELAKAADIASLISSVREAENPTSWGGTYSVYDLVEDVPPSSNNVRRDLVSTLNRANLIHLELAATAAFLASEGYQDSWEETKKRKPNKSRGENLTAARELYSAIASKDTPVELPSI